MELDGCRFSASCVALIPEGARFALTILNNVSNNGEIIMYLLLRLMMFVLSCIRTDVFPALLTLCCC